MQMADLLNNRCKLQETYKSTFMKAKYILFTIACAISVCASAVEYGQYQPVYQTSNVRMTTIGSYGSGMSFGTSYSSSFPSTSSMSASGSAYAPSVSMPFARTRRSASVGGFMSADDNLARSLQPNPPYGSRNKARRINHDAGNGNDFGEVSDDGWIWDGEEWTLAIGAKKIGPDGYTYEWDGSVWKKIGYQDDPNTPVGSIPWLLMVLLVGAYAYRHKKEVI